MSLFIGVILNGMDGMDGSQREVAEEEPLSNAAAQGARRPMDDEVRARWEPNAGLQGPIARIELAATTDERVRSRPGAVQKAAE